MVQVGNLSKPIQRIICADSGDVLPQMPSETFDLIYIDPPFNTGKKQSRTNQGKTIAYDDSFDDFRSFLRPRLEDAYRLLSPSGSFFCHLDYREVHYCKIWLDEIFGRQSFMNEIIWAYDYGGRSRRKWSCKHDSILWYAKDPANYTFNYAEMDRIPYMAPGLVGKEKAAIGKTPTDVWWHTIVPTNSMEKTGYPTQKPLGVISRIVKVHSCPSDLLLDFFAGSGTFGLAAQQQGRSFVLVDNNPLAIRLMKKRFGPYDVEIVE
jgi:site-specific DNA-methyltransferase (adenine-specific)